MSSFYEVNQIKSGSIRGKIKISNIKHQFHCIFLLPKSQGQHSYQLVCRSGPVCALKTKQTDKESKSSADAILQIRALCLAYLCTAVHTEKSAVSVPTDIIIAFENSFIHIAIISLHSVVVFSYFAFYIRYYI